MRVGNLVYMEKNPYECIKHYAVDLGGRSGQLAVWDMSLYTSENAELVLKACEDFEFTITAVWCGWSGPHDWKYPGMYSTIGLVPEDWRQSRICDILKGAEFARQIGVKDIITHAGYMSENPFSPDRIGVMNAVRYICQEIKKYGQRFLFETGEMNPNTLIKLIDDIGEPNIGVNFDCANMIINARCNSVDALKMLIPYVCGVHAKDAIYPEGVNPKGKEVKVGEGLANFPVLISILHENAYKGDITIEREIDDPILRDNDIIDTKNYLEGIISQLK